MRIGKATKKCHICGRPYTSLCDATNKDGEPCDLPMCDTHRNRVGLDVDVCDVHDNHIDREQAKKNRHESKKAIRKSITALRIMSENCNKYEDYLAYKDRYTSLILGMDALKKQIELMEWIEELGKENEYDMRMIKEVVDILREVSIL